MSGSGDGCPVLVGYDGSMAADHALRWAVEEAQLRDLPLTVCHAWQWPYPLSAPDEDTIETLRGAGAVVADAGVRRARALATQLQVRWWTAACHSRARLPSTTTSQAGRDVCGAVPETTSGER